MCNTPKAATKVDLFSEYVRKHDAKGSNRVHKIKRHYEGDSICNEIVPINQKDLFLYALQLHSQKGLLLGYTTATSQVSSSFTTLHNLLSRKGTKLHCDTNLSSVFKFRILYELSLFSVCLFVW